MRRGEGSLAAVPLRSDGLRRGGPAPRLRRWLGLGGAGVLRLDDVGVRLAGGRRLASLGVAGEAGRVPEATELDRVRESGRHWSAALGYALARVKAEEEARQALERRYFEGQSVLFRDAANRWADLHAEVACLLGLHTGLREVLGEARAADVSPPVPDVSDMPGCRPGERARRLADDARIRAFETLGDRPRAVAIMDRRLRALSADGQRTPV